MHERPDPARHVEHLDPHPLLETEQLRAIAFLEGLDHGGWEVSTACPGWRRRELAAHLAASEDYNRSTLDATRSAFIAEGTAAGAHDLDSFNAWGVRRHAERSASEVVDELRGKSAAVRRDLRDRGDGDLDTMAGAYSARLQAFHLAFESAIHNDDMDVPVAAAEQAGRDAWRAAVARFMIEEAARHVVLEVLDGRTHVHNTDSGAEATLVDADLVKAASGRLRDREALYPPSVVAALRAHG